jgi:hypothetical protein
MKSPVLACSATDGGWYLGGMTKTNTVVANIVSEKKRHGNSATSVYAYAYEG